MAVIFVESFDGVSTIGQLAGVSANDPNFKWSRHGTGADFSLTTGHTGNGLKVITTDPNNWIYRNIPSGKRIIRVGFWWKPGGTNGTRGMVDIVTVGGVEMVLERTGTELILRSGSGTGSVTTSGLGLNTSTWYYIEIGVNSSANPWVNSVRVNGSQVLSDSVSATASDVATVALGATVLDAAAQLNDIFDDLYIDDANFRGISTVYCIRPDGNGNSSQWVNTGGNSTNNYSYVDEQSVDNTDYVEATTDGDKDTYTHEDVAGLTTANVGAVQVNTKAQYTGTAKKLAHVFRYSGVEADSADITLTTNLTDYQSIFTTDPSAGAITLATVNASEWGCKQRP